MKKARTRYRVRAKSFLDPCQGDDGESYQAGETSPLTMRMRVPSNRVRVKPSKSSL